MLGLGAVHSVRIVGEGRPESMPANLRLLARTKGYDYRGYLPSLLKHVADDSPAALRPLLGFEAADLQRSMFYHYGLRGHLDYGFLEQVGRDGFKPPLWYGAPQFCVRGATPCPPWTSCSSMQSPCWPPMLQ